MLAKHGAVTEVCCASNVDMDQWLNAVVGTVFVAGEMSGLLKCTLCIQHIPAGWMISCIGTDY